MKRLTLEEAAIVAFREGLAPSSYRGLDQGQLVALVRLLKHTRWHAPPEGWLLAFHGALRNAAYRRSRRLRRQNRDRFSKADRLEIDASSLWDKAGRSERSGADDSAIRLYHETSDMLDVLADAYEEENDVFGAATARERACMARARADEIKSMTRRPAR